MVGEGTYTVITGASHGIGRALAQECARRGMNLLLISRGNGLAELRDELEAQYEVKVYYLALDLLDPDAGDRIAAYCTQNRLEISVLINNAGSGFLQPFMEASGENLRDVMYLNSIAPVNVTRSLLQLMQGEGKRYILFVGSIAGSFPVPYKSVYSASKAAIRYLAMALQEELIGYGIHVSLICPGFVPTDDKRIAAGTNFGWMAKPGKISAEALAHKSVSGLLKGKKVIRVRVANDVATSILSLLPKRISAHFGGRIFRRMIVKNIRY